MSCDLHEFVNRVAALDTFTALRKHRGRRLLLIQGPPLIGKSCLVHRLRQECRGEGIVSALVDFQDEPPLQDEVAIIGRLREQIGGDFNRQLAETSETAQRHLAASVAPAAAAAARPAPRATAGPAVAIEGDLNTGGGNFVGRDSFVFNNSPITVTPGRGTELLQREMLTQLNVAFREALANLVAGESAFLFFDHFERAGQTVAHWLQGQLLALHLQEKPGFDQLWLIVAGRQVPLQGEVDRWRHVLAASRLEPLAEEDIRTFWVDRRGLDPAHLASIVPASGGQPGLLAMMANNFDDLRG